MQHPLYTFWVEEKYKKRKEGVFLRSRRTDITVEPLGNGIWRLNEYDFVNCFLVEGEEKACLIDTGAGVADIAAVAKSLTDKPITVLITHAHADHAGGAVWFPEVYIHPADKKASHLSMSTIGRAYFLYSHQYKRKTHHVPYSASLQKDFRPVLKDLNEGDTFDLGGRVIETWLTPGHTPGSVTFRDSLTGDLFTGDNVTPMVTLHFPRGETVETWLEGAKRTLALEGEGRLLVGHGNQPVPKEWLAAVIGWAEELVQKGNGKGRKVRTKRGEEKVPCLVYRQNRVTGASRAKEQK